MGSRWEYAMLDPHWGQLPVAARPVAMAPPHCTWQRTSVMLLACKDRPRIRTTGEVVVIEID